MFFVYTFKHASVKKKNSKLIFSCQYSISDICFDICFDSAYDDVNYFYSYKIVPLFVKCFVFTWNVRLEREGYKTSTIYGIEWKETRT